MNNHNKRIVLEEAILQLELDIIADEIFLAGTKQSLAVARNQLADLEAEMHQGIPEPFSTFYKHK